MYYVQFQSLKNKLLLNTKNASFIKYNWSLFSVYSYTKIKLKLSQK